MQEKHCSNRYHETSETLMYAAWVAASGVGVASTAAYRLILLAVYVVALACYLTYDDLGAVAGTVHYAPTREDVNMDPLLPPRSMPSASPSPRGP
ncbi:hypothetical protein OG948_34440 (plasmid) [Embleya sp. NBC_00888]|uniref:hypothetical protein n=1 Tax=Embleya sp. NBC_00888 TaxID=2975960 RepID=UPI002F9126E5|nr:hypothetical protein OG948_34440 [Embleya sp. NBC_00888]